jgi:hypothetical protein
LQLNDAGGEDHQTRQKKRCHDNETRSEGMGGKPGYHCHAGGQNGACDKEKGKAGPETEKGLHEFSCWLSEVKAL